MLKYWEIELDGVDKTGKDLLCYYLCKLSNYTLSINVRGLISQIAYNEKFNRDIEYDITNISKNKIFILLTAEEEDLYIRCKNTNEELYDFKKDLKLFNTAANTIQSYGYTVWKFNTSEFTPYILAKLILVKLSMLEEEDINGHVS